MMRPDGRAGRMIVLLAVLFPIVAMADPQPETVEPGIEAEVEQCRKDCIEASCAPQFRSCVNASGEATPACKVMRDECEKRCVEVDCMT